MGPNKARPARYKCFHERPTVPKANNLFKHALRTQPSFASFLSPDSFSDTIHPTTPMHNSTIGKLSHCFPPHASSLRRFLFSPFPCLSSPTAPPLNLPGDLITALDHPPGSIPAEPQIAHSQPLSRGLTRRVAAATNWYTDRP